MGGMMKFFLNVFMFVTLMATAAHATPVTVTFDSTVSSYNPTTNAEIGVSQGFRYDYSTVYLSGRHVALHDDSGILTSSIKSVNGSLFTPHSIDVFGTSRLNKSGSGLPPIGNYSAQYAWATSGTAPLPQLLFQGMLKGVAIASQTVGPTAWSNMSFSSAFSGIDSLLVSLNIPVGALRTFGPDQIGPNTVWCEQWCAEFQIDNLSLSTNAVAPVPLPAGIFLFLSALLGLGLVRTRA